MGSPRRPRRDPLGLSAAAARAIATGGDPLIAHQFLKAPPMGEALSDGRAHGVGRRQGREGVNPCKPVKPDRLGMRSNGPRMSEADSIHASGDQPVTREELVADLLALGVGGERPILVHSSLSRLGWVCGGAQAVLEALHQVIGSGGTLVMPAFTGDYSEPSHWQHPPVPESWWPVIRDSMPAFDPARSPTRMMGALVDLFRAWPGVRRSNHPHDSFLACGPLADELLRLPPGPPVDGFGESSPLARLYDLDARVLLLGVSHANNTSLHLAEQRAEWSGKRTIETGAPVMLDGRRVWHPFEVLYSNDDDFPRIGEAFGDRQARGKMGRGEARWMAQREIVDFAVAWMNEHRPGSLQSSPDDTSG